MTHFSSTFSVQSTDTYTWCIVYLAYMINAIDPDCIYSHIIRPRYKDSELWHVLGQVELTEVVTAVGGLNAPVSEDGANWSQGQYVSVSPFLSIYLSKNFSL